MVKMMKRGLALVLTLVMCLSFLPVIPITADAADVSYVYDGKYIYNWGERGETATFLSPKAKEFYSGSNAYSVLSTYSGGTSTATAPNSQLYKALQTLMKSNHSYQTSYDATKELFKYTDCENSGGKISSFYSGDPIGPNWGNGWNREHTWPNSKGLGGADENDIMMLRPTSTSENSSRGNKAYGKSSGYYNPNSESDGEYDLRGDVARIFLYVYVRWGNTSGNGSYSTWGSNGVMESLEVLLEWMEADPVDTWEMGRNDSVEAITGTRNVFVDYPEYAFLLFGEDIPVGMTTPSGGTNGDCGHNNYSVTVIAPGCTTVGYTLYTCKISGCGHSYKTGSTPAIGHSYSQGVCTECGTAQPQEPTYVSSFTVGQAYKLGLYSTQKSTEYYFTGTMSGYYGATDTSYDNGVDVFVESASGGYHLYFKDSDGKKQYINIVINGTHTNFTYSTTASTVFTWDSAKSSFKATVSSSGTCYIGTYGEYVTMSVLTEAKVKDSDYFARLYTKGTVVTPENPSCEHEQTKEVVAKTSTCQSAGTAYEACADCGTKIANSDKTIPLADCRYEDDRCVWCGEVDPDADAYSVTFKVDGRDYIFDEFVFISFPTYSLCSDYEGYEFVGWTTMQIDESDSKPALYEPGDELRASEGMVFYAVFSMESGDSTASGEYTLVTDQSQLVIGNTIVIVAKDYNYALGGKRDNNRAQAEVVKSGSTVTLGSDVQIITLEAGKVEGTYAFNIGGEYLYSASSTSNYLRTETTLSDNGSWKITISSDGTASVVSQGKNTRNTMQYNQSAKLFASYGGATQKPISIYTPAMAATLAYTTDLDGVCTHESASITDVSLNAGKDLSLKYGVTLAEGEDISDYKMVFTMNGKTYEVTECELVNGKYVFSFKGITPQCIGDNVGARLYKGDTLVAARAQYSVRQYAEDFMALYGSNEDYAALKALLGDILAYGEAAKEYKDYDVDNSVLVDGLEASDALPTEDDDIRELVKHESVEGVGFNGVTVNFDYLNRIAVKLTAPDLSKVVVKVTIAGKTTEYTTADGIVYSDTLAPTDFDEAVSFELYYDGALVQTVTYSVNSYACAKAGEDTAAGRLALALYRYGISAEAAK